MGGAIRFLLWPAVAMSLGWGLRGYIGGGPFGAMIPGAMVALVLCRVLGIGPGRSALIAAFGAVGVGFGGEMTYGQTVGFARDPATVSWGLLGLATKGGVWGLLGGAVLGAGFVFGGTVRQRWPWALAGLVGATAAGWALVNAPKLVYFSNRLDRPREEVWFGLLVAGVAVVALVASRVVATFALAGLCGGFLGFGGGGLWIYAGGIAGPEFSWIPWWKLMEFTFGAVFGLALAGAAWRTSAELRHGAESGEVRGGNPLVAVAGMTILSGMALLGGELIPVRFGYALVGAGLLAVVAYLPRWRWWIALAITAAAYFTDWAEDHAENPETLAAEPAWAIAVAACLIFFYVLAARLRHGPLTAQKAFWLLLWPAMFTAWARGLTAETLSRGMGAEHLLFAALLLWLLWFERREPVA